jgi:cytochrome c556
MSRVKFLAIAAFLLAELPASFHVFAQQEVIDKRKALMNANGKAIVAIGNAAKEKDYAAIQLKAKEITEGLDAAAKLFPPGSTGEKSRAHPDIWAKPDEFKNSLTNARKAAEAVTKAAAAKDEADVMTKVKDLGNSKDGACGACHKVFRSDFRKEG